jgi:hypothetical protein
MKQVYNYRLHCDGIIDGTLVSFRAESREQADAQMAAHIANMQRGKIGYSFVRCGKLTMAQLTGSVGGAKSKREISPRQQAAMQKARREKRRGV